MIKKSILFICVFVSTNVFSYILTPGENIDNFPLPSYLENISANNTITSESIGIHVETCNTEIKVDNAYDRTQIAPICGYYQYRIDNYHFDRNRVFWIKKFVCIADGIHKCHFESEQLVLFPHEIYKKEKHRVGQYLHISLKPGIYTTKAYIIIEGEEKANAESEGKLRVYY